ncbi:metal ABC transporter substrate-binding protein [Nocardioides sp. Leaf374]|uniref:metal ABC transporter substrate-binding protein n=1 Tax=Nocardioides sp. Leaf374 TaxID=2876560 RepID=UPI001E48B1BF|nr:metal ABC transporter substrate-binding protein [Nocardioides sp. Leaf374]
MTSRATRATRPVRQRLLSPAVAGVAALALSSCAAFSDDTGTASDDGDVTVAAAFYPLQFVAQRVAGDRTEVANLTKPGGEPHDLELSVGQTAEVAGADLVVYEADFQPAVDAAVEQNAEGATLDAAEVVGLEPFADEHSEEEHADDSDSEEEHAEEEHDHGDLDPHFWLDPARLAELGDAVAEQLAEIDPDGAETYTANAATLREDLETLDGELSEGLADCERSTIVVSHDAFGYLGKYGIEVEPIAGLSPDAEPTPADLARLQQIIDEDGITTVFSERLVSPALSESLARDKGIETAVLDPVEGLSDETADEDYLSLMRENLAALRTANGCR